MTIVFPVARAGPIFQLTIKTARAQMSVNVFGRESKSRVELTREVPGDDLTNDTEWLMECVGEFLAVSFDGFTVGLISPACIVSDGGNGRGDVCIPSPSEGLAWTANRQVPESSVTRPAR